MCINAWVTSLDRKLRPFGSGWGGDPRLEQGSGEGRSHRGLVLFSRLHLRLCIPNSSEPSLRRTESREPQAMGCRKRRFWWREVRAGGAGSNPARGDHCWGSWQPGSSEPSKDAKKGGRGQRGGAKENCLAGPVCQACCPRPRPLWSLFLPSPRGSPCLLPTLQRPCPAGQSPPAVPAATAWDGTSVSGQD